MIDADYGLLVPISLMLQWLATAYSGAVALVLSVILARVVGPEALGEYAVALAAGGLLAILIDGGLHNFLLRQSTRFVESPLGSAGQLNAIALGHATTVAAAFSLLAFCFSENVSLSLATVVWGFGTVLVGYVSAFLRGQGRWGADAGWQAGQRTLSAALIICTLALGLTAPWQIMVAWAVASLTACFLFPSPVLCRPELGLNLELYRVTAPLALINLATAIYFRSDMLVLGWFDVPQQATGQYAAAYRLFEAVIMALGPVGLLLFRRIRLFEGGAQGFGRSLMLYLAGAAALGIGMTLAMCTAADLLVGWLYGPQYPDSAGLLRVLCWGLVFVPPNIVLTQAALALELDRAYLWAAGLSALINVTMNCALVPRLGISAAAYTTVVTEAVLFIYLATALLGKQRTAA